MRLSEPPAHIQSCFEKVTDIPVEEVEEVEALAIQAQNDPVARAKLEASARKLIAKIRRSEVAKTRCGQQLLKFYGKVKANAAKRSK